jgi:hypothetical protein
VREEPGKDSHTFRVFIPVLLVELQAGALAERLEPADMVLLEGKLAYRTGKGKTEESGKLVVIYFAVERLNAGAMAVSAD